MYDMRKVIISILFCLLSSYSVARNLGTQGHTWEIIEDDILLYIQEQLEKLDLEKLKRGMTDKTTKTVEEPDPVSFIEDSQDERLYSYDPTYILDKDIYDHKGKLLYHKGFKINPLEKIPLRERLIFINGNNKYQINYALKIRKDTPSKIILTSGKPLELQRKEKVWIYFDQRGVLTSKFGISKVPAIVEQEGLKLKIKEVKREEWES